MPNRYNQLERYADLGEGTEEFEGPERFTRPCERIARATSSAEFVQDDYLDARVRLRLLDKAADLLHELLAETPQDDQMRDRLRDLAFAVKDLADEFGAEMTMPPVHPAKNVTEGDSNHQKES